MLNVKTGDYLYYVSGKCPAKPGTYSGKIIVEGISPLKYLSTSIINSSSISREIFIRNLSFSTTDEQLKEFFTNHIRSSFYI